MKTLFKWIAIIIVGLLLFDWLVDDEMLESSDEPGYYDDQSEDADDADAGDIYGNAADDDLATTAPVSDWGDGTCREISAKEFYQLVAKKSKHDVFIGEGPVVVDFWASWCGYCKQIDPSLKALAKKYKGKVQFYKVNADENAALTNAYGIEGLPTLFFCADGDITIKAGAYSQSELEKMVKALL